MKVEIKQVEQKYDGFVKVEKAILRFERFNGQMTSDVTRYRFFRGDAVAVLLFDPSTRRVLLQRQFRYTAHVKTGEGWLTECVAGMMEPNETALDVAKREVLEETGFKLKKVDLLAHYFIGPGGSSDQVYLYRGEVENQQQSPGVYGLMEEGEEIQAQWVSLGEALQLADQGQIRDAKTLIALLLLDRRLREPTSGTEQGGADLSGDCGHI
jgi:nudix-type nucleoside diphosphatase (YffH/AdpP family)